jgi:hypothetical protein
MAGEEPTPSPDGASAIGASPVAQSNALEATISQFAGIEQILNEAAQTHPEANNEIRAAIDAVRSVMKAIAAAPTPETEPIAPGSLA